MSDLICPFSATLAKDDFGCRHARQVIRRGGAEFACGEPAAHARCRQLFEKLKAVALPAFDVEDDLMQMPQSIIVKVQFGGLLGLRRIMHGNSLAQERIDDIDGLLDAVFAGHPGIDAIPFEQLVGDITGYRLSRRRNR